MDPSERPPLSPVDPQPEVHIRQPDGVHTGRVVSPLGTRLGMYGRCTPTTGYPGGHIGRCTPTTGYREAYKGGIPLPPGYQGGIYRCINPQANLPGI